MVYETSYIGSKEPIVKPAEYGYIELPLVIFDLTESNYPMSSITPSVGRKVWFFADDKQVEPWDATVIKVHAPAHQANPSVAVNLLVIDPDNGDSIFYEHVVASTTALPYPHYRWMPYQEAQAAKANSVGMQSVGAAPSCVDLVRQYVNR